ncbi:MULTISPECIES: winged helix-turn-helix transcriptional regulator [Paraclostridium]|uniref:Transcriptional regulator n=1 Tax=Paraclostridium bifermentans TaxID=1490 RepID=A0A5P3XCY6_PARBF|nr:MULTISPECIES: helix-turn-helix domain-containing protein [Paraclostridium]MCU9808609.1 helix-turn-helix transcriptional regulator [Paraclostridium sp. AKS46]MDV8115116.1 helix-turn-helix domain-containing protein [Bacillus sp. BAU-SS-2023]EQK44501.1 hxlR-like helix-turn-helix family protein [[Clostridium] bifermentans ATCC 19299] [Paraclostridium bifermentans ATCC 19299]MBN8049476.1 helix-turn-helix transcriptional regulator [Paraclostridium bifermentans]MBZ6007476.1 helix-turn-helix transc
MYNVSDMTFDCPVEALSSIVGKKWVARIVWEIQDNKIRFGELQRKIDGCSKKMLVQQLDLLVENNIVINNKKVVKNSIESTYYLSKSGLELLHVIANMIKWSNEHIVCND